MKKVISIICITLLVALYSCDERDDLRSDIDNLKERVANLEASIEQMNSDISNYQQMVEGKILVVGYSKDEQDNYTIELSNGETITIYSGKVDMNDMPLFSVNASGHWAYTINDMTTELLVNDKPVSAIPEAGTAGVTPKLKVDANGFWLISILEQTGQQPDCRRNASRCQRKFPVQQRDHRRSDRTDHLYHPCRQQPSKSPHLRKRLLPDNQV
jgi:hypothetical protein